MNEEEYLKIQKKHTDNVLKLLERMAEYLNYRGLSHDLSKNFDPEKKGFIKMIDNLKDLTYGSKEYFDTLKANKNVIDSHYEENRHHPEYFDYVWNTYCPICGKYYQWTHGDKGDAQNTYECRECVPIPGLTDSTVTEKCWDEDGTSISKMNIIDVIEMFCDWYAAVAKHKDGSFFKSIKVNSKRFKMSKQLEAIFMNSIRLISDIDLEK